MAEDERDLGTAAANRPLQRHRRARRCLGRSGRSLLARRNARGGLRRGPTDLAFEGGAEAFFNTGTNGRWQGVLDDEQLARYDALVAEGLKPAAASWLEMGSLESGTRPSEI